MKITIVCVGKIKESFYREALNEYTKRLSKYCKLEIIEVADEKTVENPSDNEVRMILEKEGQRILSKIDSSSYLISTAIEGDSFDSVSFSKFIDSLGVSGKSSLTFVIGGSLGISEEIKKKSNQLISFSKMTFPHQLMRVILLEQIYRAFRISNNEPYHK